MTPYTLARTWPILPCLYNHTPVDDRYALLHNRCRCLGPSVGFARRPHILEEVGFGALNVYPLRLRAVHPVRASDILRRQQAQKLELWGGLQGQPNFQAIIGRR